MYCVQNIHDSGEEEGAELVLFFLLLVFQLFQGLLNMWMSSSYPAFSCLWLW